MADTSADLALDKTPTSSSTSNAKQQKAALKAQKRIVSEFADAAASVQAQHEASMAQGGAVGDLAKQRRKAFRDVIKVVSDTSMPLEERMQLLQTRYISAMQEQQRRDKETLQLQAQLDASQQDADAGRTELARSQQKLDGLQKLARTLQAEHKVLQLEVQHRTEASDRVQGIIQDITTKIELHKEETSEVRQHNMDLQNENSLLRAQLQATSGVLDALKNEQQQRLDALAEKLKEQSDATVQAQETHAAMAVLLQENKDLKVKAAAAVEMQERIELLTKLVGESQAQNEAYQAQMREVQSTLKAASSLAQAMEQMKTTSTQQQQMMHGLLKERQLLQQQVQLLQQQARDQAEKLRRSQLQKQRLEGLCRGLQARSGAAAAGLGPREADDAAVEEAVGSSDSSCSSSSRSSSGGGDADGIGGGTTQLVRRVVRAAFDAVMQQHSTAVTVQGVHQA